MTAPACAALLHVGVTAARVGRQPYGVCSRYGFGALVIAGLLAALASAGEDSGAWGPATALLAVHHGGDALAWGGSSSHALKLSQLLVNSAAVYALAATSLLLHEGAGSDQAPFVSRQLGTQSSQILSAMDTEADAVGQFVQRIARRALVGSAAPAAAGSLGARAQRALMDARVAGAAWGELVSSWVEREPQAIKGQRRGLLASLGLQINPFGVSSLSASEQRETDADAASAVALGRDKALTRGPAATGAIISLLSARVDVSALVSDALQSAALLGSTDDARTIVAHWLGLQDGSQLSVEWDADIELTISAQRDANLALHALSRLGGPPPPPPPPPPELLGPPELLEQHPAWRMNRRRRSLRL
ncbi:hypothetical protein T492DRAFT_834257 [Pavlovales sp. CCMP2436]|nr:hypothetical protein T492DRAFT_834257 [Pavlovales sp. CCMP2436]